MEQFNGSSSSEKLIPLIQKLRAQLALYKKKNIQNDMFINTFRKQHILMTKLKDELQDTKISLSESSSKLKYSEVENSALRQSLKKIQEDNDKRFVTRCKDSDLELQTLRNNLEIAETELRALKITYNQLNEKLKETISSKSGLQESFTEEKKQLHAKIAEKENLLMKFNRVLKRWSGIIDNPKELRRSVLKYIKLIDKRTEGASLEANLLNCCDSGELGWESDVDNDACDDSPKKEKAKGISLVSDSSDDDFVEVAQGKSPLKNSISDNTGSRIETNIDVTKLEVFSAQSDRKKPSPSKGSPRKASPRKASPRKASPRSPRKSSPRKKCETITGVMSLKIGGTPEDRRSDLVPTGCDLLQTGNEKKEPLENLCVCLVSRIDRLTPFPESCLPDSGPTVTPIGMDSTHEPKSNSGLCSICDGLLSQCNPCRLVLQDLLEFKRSTEVEGITNVYQSPIRELSTQQEEGRSLFSPLKAHGPNSNDQLINDKSFLGKESGSSQLDLPLNSEKNEKSALCARKFDNMICSMKGFFKTSLTNVITQSELVPSQSMKKFLKTELDYVLKLSDYVCCSGVFHEYSSLKPPVNMQSFCVSHPALFPANTDAISLYGPFNPGGCCPSNDPGRRSRPSSGGDFPLFKKEESSRPNSGNSDEEERRSSRGRRNSGSLRKSVGKQGRNTHTCRTSLSPTVIQSESKRTEGSDSSVEEIEAVEGGTKRKLRNGCSSSRNGTNPWKKVKEFNQRDVRPRSRSSSASSCDEPELVEKRNCRPRLSEPSSDEEQERPKTKDTSVKSIHRIPSPNEIISEENLPLEETRITEETPTVVQAELSCHSSHFVKDGSEVLIEQETRSRQETQNGVSAEVSPRLLPARSEMKATSTQESRNLQELQFAVPTTPAPRAPSALKKNDLKSRKFEKKLQAAKSSISFVSGGAIAPSNDFKKSSEYVRSESVDKSRTKAPIVNGGMTHATALRTKEVLSDQSSPGFKHPETRSAVISLSACPEIRKPKVSTLATKALSRDVKSQGPKHSQDNSSLVNSTCLTVEKPRKELVQPETSKEGVPSMLPDTEACESNQKTRSAVKSTCSNGGVLMGDLFLSEDSDSDIETNPIDTTENEESKEDQSLGKRHENVQEEDIRNVIVTEGKKQEVELLESSLDTDMQIEKIMSEMDEKEEKNIAASRKRLEDRENSQEKLENSKENIFASPKGDEVLEKVRVCVSDGTRDKLIASSDRKLLEADLVNLIAKDQESTFTAVEFSSKDGVEERRNEALVSGEVEFSSKDCVQERRNADSLSEEVEFSSKDGVEERRSAASLSETVEFSSKDGVEERRSAASVRRAVKFSSKHGVEERINVASVSGEVEFSSKDVVEERKKAASVSGEVEFSSKDGVEDRRNAASVCGEVEFSSKDGVEERRNAALVSGEVEFSSKNGIEQRRNEASLSGKVEFSSQDGVEERRSAASVSLEIEFSSKDLVDERRNAASVSGEGIFVAGRIEMDAESDVYENQESLPSVFEPAEMDLDAVDLQKNASQERKDDDTQMVMDAIKNQESGTSLISTLEVEKSVVSVVNRSLTGATVNGRSVEVSQLSVYSCEAEEVKDVEVRSGAIDVAGGLLVSVRGTEGVLQQKRKVLSTSPDKEREDVIEKKHRLDVDKSAENGHADVDSFERPDNEAGNPTEDLREEGSVTIQERGNLSDYLNHLDAAEIGELIKVFPDVKVTANDLDLSADNNNVCLSISGLSDSEDGEEASADNAETSLDNNVGPKTDREAIVTSTTEIDLGQGPDVGLFDDLEETNARIYDEVMLKDEKSGEQDKSLEGDISGSVFCSLFKDLPETDPNLSNVGDLVAAVLSDDLPADSPMMVVDECSNELPEKQEEDVAISDSQKELSTLRPSTDSPNNSENEVSNVKPVEMISAPSSVSAAPKRHIPFVAAPSGPYIMRRRASLAVSSQKDITTALKGKKRAGTPPYDTKSSGRKLRSRCAASSPVANKRMKFASKEFILNDSSSESDDEKLVISEKEHSSSGGSTPVRCHDSSGKSPSIVENSESKVENSPGSLFQNSPPLPGKKRRYSTRLSASRCSSQCEVEDSSDRNKSEEIGKRGADESSSLLLRNLRPRSRGSGGSMTPESKRLQKSSLRNGSKLDPSSPNESNCSDNETEQAGGAETEVTDTSASPKRSPTAPAYSKRRTVLQKLKANLCKIHPLMQKATPRLEPPSKRAKSDRADESSTKPNIEVRTANSVTSLQLSKSGRTAVLLTTDTMNRRQPKPVRPKGTPKAPSPVGIPSMEHPKPRMTPQERLTSLQSSPTKVQARDIDATSESPRQETTPNKLLDGRTSTHPIIKTKQKPKITPRQRRVTDQPILTTLDESSSESTSQNSAPQPPTPSPRISHTTAKKECGEPLFKRSNSVRNRPKIPEPAVITSVPRILSGAPEQIQSTPNDLNAALGVEAVIPPRPHLSPVAPVLNQSIVSIGAVSVKITEMVAPSSSIKPSDAGAVSSNSCTPAGQVAGDSTPTLRKPVTSNLSLPQPNRPKRSDIWVELAMDDSLHQPHRREEEMHNPALLLSAPASSNEAVQSVVSGRDLVAMINSTPRGDSFSTDLVNSDRHPLLEAWRNRGANLTYLRNQAAAEGMEYSVPAIKKLFNAYLSSPYFTEELLSRTVNSLMNPKYICVDIIVSRLTVDMVEADFDSQPCTDTSGPGQFLTKVQQQLIALLMRLFPKYRSIVSDVVLLIEHRMFSFSYTAEQARISWLSVFHTSLCRIMKWRITSLIFCYDAMYRYVSRFSIVLCSVFQVWPELLPNFIDSNTAGIIVQVMFHYIMTQGEPDKQSDLKVLRHLLIRKRVFSGRTNSSELTQIVTRSLKDGQCGPISPALILISKREDIAWAQDKIVNQHLLPMIGDWLKNDDPGCPPLPAAAVLTVCGIVRAFRGPESAVSTTHTLMKTLLETKAGDFPDLEHATCAGFVFLSRHNIEFVTENLKNWRPKNKYPQWLIDILLGLINNRARPSEWWSKEIRSLVDATGWFPCSEKVF